MSRPGPPRVTSNQNRQNRSKTTMSNRQNSSKTLDLNQHTTVTARQNFNRNAAEVSSPESLNSRSSMLRTPVRQTMSRGAKPSGTANGFYDNSRRSQARSESGPGPGPRIQSQGFRGGGGRPGPGQNERVAAAQAQTRNATRSNLNSNSKNHRSSPKLNITVDNKGSLNCSECTTGLTSLNLSNKLS